MQSENFNFTSEDGLEVHARKWMPVSGAPRGVVQIHHGMAEHIARYAPVAEALAARGVAVYGSDHRGHGRSVAGQEDLGHAADEEGWAKSVADMLKLNGLIKAEHPGLPHILLAHSMGSFMGQHFIIDHPEAVDAVAFSGTNGRVGLLADVGRLVAKVERRRLGKRGRSKLLDKMSFGAFNKAFKPSRTDFDWISRDPAEVDKYIADPWCGFMVTTQFWVDMLAGLRYIEDPANQAKIKKSLPVYIFSGARDPVGGETKGLRQLLEAYGAAGLTNVTHRFYPEGRHEMFNETNREEVLQDLGDWVETVIG